MINATTANDSHPYGLKDIDVLIAEETRKDDQASPTIVHRPTADALAWLIETYPLAFATGSLKRALKADIVDDILWRDTGSHSDKDIRSAVANYRVGTDYARCLARIDQRVDLEGDDVGRISDRQCDLAADKLRRREESAEDAEPEPDPETETLYDSSCIKIQSIAQNTWSAAIALGEEYGGHVDLIQHGLDACLLAHVPFQYYIDRYLRKLPDIPMNDLVNEIYREQLKLRKYR